MFSTCFPSWAGTEPLMRTWFCSHSELAQEPVVLLDSWMCLCSIVSFCECTDTDEHEKRLNLLLTHCGLPAAADQDWDGPRPSKCDLSVESRLINDKINSLNWVQPYFYAHTQSLHLYLTFSPLHLHVITHLSQFRVFSSDMSENIQTIITIGKSNVIWIITE